MADSSSLSYTPMPSTVIALLSAAGVPYAPPASSSSSATASTFTTIPSSTLPSIHITSHAASRTHEPQRGHNALPSEAAAGIGVGATLGVVLLVLAILAVMWRRRKSRLELSIKDEERPSSDSNVEVQVVWPKPAQDVPEKQSEAPLTSPTRSEAPDTSPNGGVNEADDTQRAELAGHWSVAELDGGYSSAEMEGSKSKGHGDLQAKASDGAERLQ